jgi:tetratricopeptide (TPR) repeat protein
MIEVLLLAAAALQLHSISPLPRSVLTLLTALSVIAAAWHPQAVFRNALAVPTDFKNELPKRCAPTVLLRDVAHRLLLANPHRIPVVLAGPNSSTDLSYYGHIHTLGTLYWENVEGLKKAAGIFAAPNAQEALNLIQQAGVTHIVVASWDDFGMDYVKLLNESGAISEAPAEPFVKSLLDGAEPPFWIRPLYYPIPAVFGLDGAQVRIFAVLPNQSPLDALIHRGTYHLDAGNSEAAKKIFQRALETSPNDARALQGLKAAGTLSTKP